MHGLNTEPKRSLASLSLPHEQSESFGYGMTAFERYLAKDHKKAGALTPAFSYSLRPKAYSCIPRTYSLPLCYKPKGQSPHRFQQ